jgi:lipoprotein-releasing system ATP-binding protein
MLDLNRELSTSLVIVTHDHAIARRMDRILVLENGRLQDAG